MSSKSNKPRKKRKKVIKWQSIILGISIAVLSLSTLYTAYKSSVPVQSDMSYIEFKEHLDNGDIESANLISSEKYFEITLKDGSSYKVINPNHDEFKKEILEAGVNVKIQSETALEAVATAMLTLPTMALVLVFIWYLMKAFGGQSNTLYRVYKPEDVVTFDHVAGMSETKEEVKFAVSQLKNFKELREMGARPCKGIILEGPPGTGKTLLAKAIAGEADVPFISTNGADFIEMFAGLGAARVRQLWELAELNAPCVVFIDEIDAVGRRRSGGGDGATTEANQTLNELLSKMDGLTPNMGVFVVGATNRISDLDPALLRPGRFDKRLYIGPPKSKKDRDEVVRVHMKNKKFSDDYDFDKASKLMFGLSGAEIEQTLNEAVLISIANNRKGIVSMQDVDNAAMKLRASGVAIKHASESDRIISAVHESGHAIVSMALGRSISKVSIMPYSSGIGGLTVEDIDDIEDKKLKTRGELYNDIKVLLAGREAEQIILGDVSIGCSNDIERASKIAFTIVNNFAMAEDNLINVMALSELGVQLADTKSMVTQANDIMLNCQKDVIDIICRNRSIIEKLRDRLLEEETVIDINDKVN